MLGKFPDLMGGGRIVASETVALDVRADFVREIEPGEIVTLSDAGVTSRRFAAPAERLAMCVFEHGVFCESGEQCVWSECNRRRERCW